MPPRRGGPHGPALVFDPAAWAAFVAAVQHGEFPV
ncbi:DUF397 domain-containing protein [Streptomyces sp. XD-27]|nr:DUF397 domain-containing protein [Streptomyces sp. XD-27]WKX72761.1 DUF397 domain-containing protein [Streptomyces sp. XD-27]